MYSIEDLGKKKHTFINYVQNNVNALDYNIIPSMYARIMAMTC